jgi:polysaccharide biosynthesis/export protein
MKRLACCLMLLSSACALAPGMKLDERAAEDRGRTKDKQYRVETVTPLLLEQLARANPPPQYAPDPLASQAAGYTYRVAPFDVLNVIVWEHPELTIPAGEFRAAEQTGSTVAADGTVFYPYVGTVRVAGKTLGEVRELLSERLSRVIRNPQLDVRIITFRGKRVQVTGEVVQPGPVPITDVPLRVQDAIAVARGFTPDAEPSAVSVARGGKLHYLDLQAFYENGEMSQNWLLQDGDVVNVGDRRQARVFVLGEVRTPAARPMIRRRLSLADALGDSNWLDPISANPAKIYVIRGDLAAPRIYRLDAESPDALILATAFALQPKDVVFVATYELSRWNRVISQILPSINLLWQSVDLGTRASDAVHPLVR